MRLMLFQVIENNPTLTDNPFVVMVNQYHLLVISLHHRQTHNHQSVQMRQEYSYILNMTFFYLLVFD
jgi:hypothetical protein